MALSLKRGLIGSAGLLALILGAGGGWLAWRDAQLSEPPSRQADATPPGPPTDSRVAVALDIPYPVVAALVEQSFDGLAGTKSGAMEAECLDILGARECLELRWRLRYDRAGKVAAQPDGRGGLRLTLPGKMDAQLGFAGLPARLLGLDRKAVTGTFTVSALVKARLGEDYCPQVDVAEVRFDWSGGAELEILQRRDLRLPGGRKVAIGPVRLPLGALLEDDLTVLLRSLARKAAAGIPCASLRAQLRDQWVGRRVGLPRPGALGAGPGLQLTLTPRSLSVADPAARPEALRLTAAMIFGAAVGPNDALVAAETPSLPPLGRMTPVSGTAGGTAGESGRISLALPVSLTYADVAEAMRLQIDALPSFDTPLGPVRLRATGVTIQPSAPLLTVGVDFVLTWPQRGRDTHGAAWLSARPTLDADARLRLEGATLRRRIDDDRLLSWGSAAAQGEILARLGQIDVDLKPLLARAAELSAEQARTLAAAYGVDLTLTAPRITLGRMILGEDDLTLEVGAEAEMTTIVRAPPK